MDWRAPAETRNHGHVEFSRRHERRGNWPQIRPLGIAPQRPHVHVYPFDCGGWSGTVGGCRTLTIMSRSLAARRHAARLRLQGVFDFTVDEHGDEITWTASVDETRSTPRSSRTELVCRVRPRWFAHVCPPWTIRLPPLIVATTCFRGVTTHQSDRQSSATKRKAAWSQVGGRWDAPVARLPGEERASQLGCLRPASTRAPTVPVVHSACIVPASSWQHWPAVKVWGPFS